jgi:hypothetical protein
MVQQQLKGGVQPVLDRLGLNLVQAQLATARHDVLVQVKLLLHMRGLGDPVSANRVSGKRYPTADMRQQPVRRDERKLLTVLAQDANGWQNIRKQPAIVDMKSTHSPVYQSIERFRLINRMTSAQLRHKLSLGSIAAI